MQRLTFWVCDKLSKGVDCENMSNNFTLRIERRAGKYSGRPRLIMASHLMTKDQFFLFTPYSQPSYVAVPAMQHIELITVHRFSRMRRIAQEYLTPKAVRQYRDMQETAILSLMLSIFKSPEHWHTELEK